MSPSATGTNKACSARLAPLRHWIIRTSVLFMGSKSPRSTSSSSSWVTTRVKRWHRSLLRGVIPVSTSLDLAIQIARGLSSAHARNIVHRDVKPSNIIITNHKLVKVVDFGLARVVATISATQSISSTRTLPYMAPEQILGEAIDQRCDIWALAIILLQMITGSHPFIRPNKGAMTFAILNQPPAALDVVPKAVHPIAYRALSKKPQGRYTGAEEMLRDLETALAEITSSPAPAEEPTLTRSANARELKQYM